MMLPEIKNYLDNVRSHLHLDPITERQVISELYTYFQEKIAELQQNGLSIEEASRVAAESSGRARAVARLMYEAYSKGSWTDALLAALPHLIIAGLFISHIWHHPLSAPIAFISIVCVTLLGWWRGKPNWLYSWIGYSLAILIIGGYASYPIIEQTVFFLWGQGTAPGIRELLLVCTFFIFSIWILVRTTIRVVRRDWVLASLMLVPLPILGSWLFNIKNLGGLFQESTASLYQWDIPMVLAFLVLGVTSATFMRLRQRVLKVGAVMIVGSIALVMTGHNLWGGLGFFGLLVLFILMLAFLFTPALIEAKIGHGEPRREAGWYIYWPEQYIATK